MLDIYNRLFCTGRVRLGDLERDRDLERLCPFSIFGDLQKKPSVDKSTMQ